MLNIRPIELSDIDGFHSALVSVIAERKYLLTLSTPSLLDTEQFINQGLKSNCPRFVADLDGMIVGWADVLPHSKEAIKHAGLLGMGVVSTQRGNGIGTLLLKNVIDQSWKIGLLRVELEVLSSNQVAIRLYERRGFEHEGKKRYARIIDGRFEDVLLMAQYRIQSSVPISDNTDPN